MPPLPATAVAAAPSSAYNNAHAAPSSTQFTTGLPSGNNNNNPYDASAPFSGSNNNNQRVYLGSAPQQQRARPGVVVGGVSGKTQQRSLSEGPHYYHGGSGSVHAPPSVSAQPGVGGSSGVVYPDLYGDMAQQQPQPSPGQSQRSLRSPPPSFRPPPPFAPPPHPVGPS